MKVSRSARPGSSANHARRSGAKPSASSASRDQACVVVGSTGASLTARSSPARAGSETVSRSSYQEATNLSTPSLLEDRDHVVVVDADRRPARPCGLRASSYVRGDLVAVDLAVVGEGVHGLLRHRVHGVGDDEVGDVHRVAVVRVLHAGRGPQRSLASGAGRLERLPALAGEELLEGVVGQPGVGDAGLAAQGERLVGADRLEPLVDLGVHAGDEERRDRVDLGEVVARCRAPSPARRRRPP